MLVYGPLGLSTISHLTTATHLSHEACEGGVPQPLRQLLTRVPKHVVHEEHSQTRNKANPYHDDNVLLNLISLLLFI